MKERDNLKSDWTFKKCTKQILGKRPINTMFIQNKTSKKVRTLPRKLTYLQKGKLDGLNSKKISNHEQQSVYSSETDWTELV